MFTVINKCSAMHHHLSINLMAHNSNEIKPICSFCLLMQKIIIFRIENSVTTVSLSFVLQQHEVKIIMKIINIKSLLQHQEIYFHRCQISAINIHHCRIQRDVLWRKSQAKERCFCLESQMCVFVQCFTCAYRTHNKIYTAAVYIFLLVGEALLNVVPV